MAGHLPKENSSFHNIPNAKIAIIASSWHGEIVTQMIEKCVEELDKLNAKCSSHILPGSLELPLAARLLFEQHSELDAIIAFGVVLKGGTTHNDTVLQHVNHGFTLVIDKFAKPIINEVIGVNNLEDAKIRASSKGIEACYAVSEFINWKRQLK